MPNKFEPVNSDRTKPFLARAVSASPLGALAIVGGVILAIVFLIRFQQIIDDVDNNDLASAIKALEITVFAVWIGIALWGWYLVRDGLERVEIRHRVEEQQDLLARISEAVEERDLEKEKKKVLTQKSRSFWDWRRNES